jgi:xanthine dehydrogenase YagR molybdenum-binding subunit
MSYDLPLERRPPLSDLTVQHVGQHMAVIVADTFENAAYAASLVELDYVTAPAVLVARDVLKGSPAPDEDDGRIRHGAYRPDHFVKLTEEELQDHRGARDEPTGTKVTADFTTPVHAHYPIELAATIAAWDGDELTIHDTTRWITGERRALAAYLDMPEEKIRILSPLVGGAFGTKSFLWMHVAICAVAAREAGRPVKLVLTRNQMFSSTGHRPRTEQHLALVADEDGMIISTEQHTLTETSTVAHFCEPAGLSARFLYRSPRLDITHTAARINAPTPCLMRGPSEAPGLFALEVAMDELAYATGIDPVELRVRNNPDVDQASGRPWSGKHLVECYRQGAERFGWHLRPMAPRRTQRNGVQVGWGMATATYPGRRMPAGCRITDVDGRVEFASATHEVGTGVRTVMSQVAADATGLPSSSVSFCSGDSRFPGRAIHRRFPDHGDRGCRRTTGRRRVAAQTSRVGCEARRKSLRHNGFRAEHRRGHHLERGRTHQGDRVLGRRNGRRRGQAVAQCRRRGGPGRPACRHRDVPRGGPAVHERGGTVESERIQGRSGKALRGARAEPRHRRLVIPCRQGDQAGKPHVAHFLR